MHGSLQPTAVGIYARSSFPLLYSNKIINLSKVRRHYCTINAKLKLAEWDADKKRSVLTPSKTRKRSQARIVKKKTLKLTQM